MIVPDGHVEVSQDEFFELRRARGLDSITHSVNEAPNRSGITRYYVRFDQAPKHRRDAHETQQTVNMLLNLLSKHRPKAAKVEMVFEGEGDMRHPVGYHVVVDLAIDA